MDTRKLEILKNDQATMLSLVEPGAGGEVIARIDPATVHNEPLREVRRRYNAQSDIVAKLEQLELRCTQARLASTIGRPRLKDADFLRTELERIGADARALLTSLNA